MGSKTPKRETRSFNDPGRKFLVQINGHPPEWLTLEEYCKVWTGRPDLAYYAQEGFLGITIGPDGVKRTMEDREIREVFDYCSGFLEEP